MVSRSGDWAGEVRGVRGTKGGMGGRVQGARARREGTVFMVL